MQCDNDMQNPFKLHMHERFCASMMVSAEPLTGGDCLGNNMSRKRKQNGEVGSPRRELNVFTRASVHGCMCFGRSGHLEAFCLETRVSTVVRWPSSMFCCSLSRKMFSAEVMWLAFPSAETAHLNVLRSLGMQSSQMKAIQSIASRPKASVIWSRRRTDSMNGSARRPCSAAIE